MKTRSNIKLVTNVVCESLHDFADKGSKGKELFLYSFNQLSGKFTYFELVALNRWNCLNYPHGIYAHQNLTSKQKKHKEAFLRDATKPFADAFWERREPLRTCDEDEGPEVDGLGIEGSWPEVALLTKSDEQAEVLTPETNEGPAEEKGRQEMILAAEKDRSMLVLAPPGTGKTHVLIERLVYLLNSDFFDKPSSQLLVLGFARATIGEVNRRIQGKLDQELSDNIRYVNIRTFDSFASGVLYRVLGEDEIHSRLRLAGSGSSYDKRITLFSDLLDKGELDSDEKIANLRFLVVDEIQDLTCARSKMVLSLMKKVKGNTGSFLFLGDPAQAIYDFSVDDTCPGGLDSQSTLKQIRYLLGDEYDEIHLSEFYRSTKPQIIQFVTESRIAMGVDGAFPDGGRLRQLIYGIGDITPIRSLPSIIAMKQRLAVLVRTNAEAHQIKVWCDNNELPVYLHKGAGSGGWPPYLARVFYGWKQDQMSLQRFEERWDQKIGQSSKFSLIEAKEMLSKLNVLSESGVDLLALRRCMNNASPPISPPANCITISTIHKAKGLEFDTVLMLEPGNKGQSAEELRVYYVGSTRATEELFLLERNRNVIRNVWDAGYQYKTDGKRLYLNSNEDLDPDILIMNDQNEENYSTTQSALWDMCRSSGEGFISAAGRKGEDRLRLSLLNRNGEIEDVCVIGDALSSALSDGRIAHVARKIKGNIHGWPVGIESLQSFAFEYSDDDATELFGKGGMILMPVLDSYIKLK